MKTSVTRIIICWCVLSNVLYAQLNSVHTSAQESTQDNAAITHTLPTELYGDATHRLLRAILLQHMEQYLRAQSQLSDQIPVAIITSLDAAPALNAAYLDIIRGNYGIAHARLASYVDHGPLLPFRARAYYLRGVAYFEQEHYGLASQQFDTAATIARAELDTVAAKDLRVNALYWGAVAAMHHASYDRAALLFRELIAEGSPYTDQAYIALGIIAEFTGDYSRALSYYDSVLVWSPTSPRSVIAHVRAAQQLILLRKPAQALQRLAAARQLHATTYQIDKDRDRQTTTLIELLTAEALNQLGQFNQAAQQYRAVLENSTLDHAWLRWQALLGLGWAELNQAHYAEALAAYSIVIDSVTDRLSPYRAQALLFRAVETKQSGNALSAIEQFDALIADASFPFRAQALLERGQIEYERHQYHTAQSLFERAYRAATDPATMLRALLLLARSQFDQGSWTAAIHSCTETMNHAQRMSPTTVPNINRITSEALLVRGIAYCNEAQYAESIADLGNFVSQDPSHPRRDEALLWLAESYERANMVENAASALEQLLNQYPNSSRREDALYNLGWALFRLRRFDEATTIFDRLLSEFPHTRFALDVTLRKADMLYLSKKYADAARLYRQVVKTTPTSDDGEYAQFQIGQALYRLGDYNNAAEQFRIFVRNFPESPIADDAVYNIAWIRMLQGRWSDAITMFETLLKSYPTSELVPQARFYIAQCTYNSGQYVRAIDLYRQFLATHPSSSFTSQAIEAIQDAYINLGQDSLAVEVVREFVERNPTSEQSAQIMLRTTDIFVRNQDFAAAVREYERFLEQYPDSRYAPEALYGLLKSLLALGKLEDAHTVLLRLQQKYPSSEFTELATLDVATTLAQQSFTQRADSLFSIVMQRYPSTQSFSRAAYERARIALSRGDTMTALALWRTATSGNGEYAYQSFYRLGMWYRERNQADSAREMFRPLITYTDNPPLAAEAAYRIAELWQRQGNCTAAQDTFSIVLDRYEGIEDWYTLSLLGLAECAESLGNIAKARELYQTLMILRPDDDFGRTAATRRRRLEKMR
jgi:TolA-binding protein